jgi:hypothetical protein
MNLLLVSLVVSLFFSVTAIVCMKKGLRRLARLALLVVAFQAIFSISFGMSGLRPHVEKAREKGADDSFVMGMVEHHRFLFFPRLAVACCIGGLVVVGLVAMKD